MKRYLLIAPMAAVVALSPSVSWAVGFSGVGGGGGGTSVLEDAVHSNGENVVPMSCRRKDTSATSATSDGHWATVDCTANGGLTVEVINGSTTVTEDGDIPASATSVAQTASVGYCGTVAHGSNPTAVAAAGRAGGKCNRAGIPFVIGGHPNIQSKEFTWTSGNAQTNVAIVTVAAGMKVVVTNAEVSCSSANTVSVSVRVGLATATLSAASTTPVAGIVLSHPGIPAGSGISRGGGASVLAVGADDEDLRITAGDPTTGSCSLVSSYYTIES